MSPRECNYTPLFFSKGCEFTQISEIIITIGAVATACLTLFGIAKSLAKYICSVYEKQLDSKNRNLSQDRDIARLKDENRLICFGLSAALDGLEQLGANHTVPIAKSKLDKYLNEQAHK